MREPTFLILAALASGPQHGYGTPGCYAFTERQNGQS
jgi:hypothetical protein